MEHLEGEQYREYSVERNPSAYMSMRDYRNLPWKSQQTVERNPNPSRSMRDYRNPPWMSAPSYMVPPRSAPYENAYNPSWGNHTNSSWESGPSQYTPPAPPYCASTPQPPQPPQLSSSIEEAILNLSKLVDTFIEERKAVNVQANKKIDTVESSIDKRIDGFQSKIDQKFDIMQNSISRLTNQHIHQEEESPEEECLSDTIVEEQCKQQLQEGLIENYESSAISAAVCPWETSPMLTKEEAVEEHQEHNLPLPPTDSVYILPSPASQSQPKIPAAEAKAIPPLLPIQYFRKLVASIQTFATTSKTLAAAHTAWHSGWFGCWFRHGAPRPQQFH